MTCRTDPRVVLLLLVCTGCSGASGGEPDARPDAATTSDGAVDDGGRATGAPPDASIRDGAQDAASDFDSGAPRPEEDFSFRGDPEFDADALDESLTDGNDLTLRAYHRKLLGTIDEGYYDDAFDRVSLRPANRTGNMHVTDMLTAGLRMLGDLRFLDEALRLLDFRKGHFSTDADGYRYWADERYDQDLDVPLMAGLIARVAYATHVNRDLASPGGWDYGAEADFWKRWLFDDYQPRWSQREGTVGELPFIHKYQGHTYVNAIATLYYMGRLGGGTVLGETFAPDDYLEAARQKLTDKLGDDATCDDGYEGRTTRVWRHAVDGSSEAAAALQYTTYVRYEVSAYMDLLLEGFDPRLTERHMTQIANSFADYVIDGDPEETGDLLASSIGGHLGEGESRCGLPWSDYRSRIRNAHSRWQDSSWAFLEGWDRRNRILQTGFDLYARGSSLRDAVAPYIAARIFTYRHHGERAFAP